MTADQGMSDVLTEDESMTLAWLRDEDKRAAAIIDRLVLEVEAVEVEGHSYKEQATRWYNLYLEAKGAAPSLQPGPQAPTDAEIKAIRVRAANEAKYNSGEWQTWAQSDRDTLLRAYDAVCERLREMDFCSRAEIESQAARIRDLESALHTTEATRDVVVSVMHRFHRRWQWERRRADRLHEECLGWLRDYMQQNADFYKEREYVGRLIAERDAARAEVSRLTREREEARSEADAFRTALESISRSGPVFDAKGTWATRVCNTARTALYAHPRPAAKEEVR